MPPPLLAFLPPVFFLAGFAFFGVAGFFGDGDFISGTASLVSKAFCGALSGFFEIGAFFVGDFFLMATFFGDLAVVVVGLVGDDKTPAAAARLDLLGVEAVVFKRNEPDAPIP